MAIPRVFISSTYYDLKHVRNDLHSFITGQGYEPVMHDRGTVAYTQDKPLEQSCYDEIGSCDILICIIGNKFGTNSEVSSHSITMEELKTAIKSQKIIYICIQKDVAYENRTYEANRDNKDFMPVYVDDIRIHEFISELKGTVKNHPVIEFENVSEIINNLKQQFAGVFLTLLRKSSSLTESMTYYDLKAVSDEIKDVVKSFKEEKEEFFIKFDTSVYASNVLTKEIFRKLGFNESIIYVKTFSGLKEFLFQLDFEYQEGISDFYFTKKTYNSRILIKLSKKAIDENDNLIIARNLKVATDLFEYTITHDDTIDIDDVPF